MCPVTLSVAYLFFSFIGLYPAHMCMYVLMGSCKQSPHLCRMCQTDVRNSHRIPTASKVYEKRQSVYEILACIAF
jgi:hypothetical protein